MNPEMFENKVKIWYEKTVDFLNEPIIQSGRDTTKFGTIDLIDSYNVSGLKELAGEYSLLVNLAVEHDNKNHAYKQFIEDNVTPNNCHNVTSFLIKDSFQSALLYYNNKYRENLIESSMDLDETYELPNLKTFEHLMNIPIILYRLIRMIHPDTKFSKKFYDDSIGKVGDYVLKLSDFHTITDVSTFISSRDETAPAQHIKTILGKFKQK